MMALNTNDSMGRQVKFSLQHDKNLDRSTPERNSNPQSDSPNQTMLEVSLSDKNENESERGRDQAHKSKSKTTNSALNIIMALENIRSND